MDHQIFYQSNLNDFAADDAVTMRDVDAKRISVWFEKQINNGKVRPGWVDCHSSVIYLEKLPRA